MAGYWPSSFFEWRSINTQKMRPISSHLDRTSLFNKGFIIIMAFGEIVLVGHGG